MKKTLLAIAVMTSLNACTPKAIYVTNNSCAGFSIIKASKQDSTETLRQILVHNRTYREICTQEQHK
ncbi:hypothetical protein A4212_09980 [Pasteurella multocida]|nr:hypothetical protein AZI96_00890 [Pasteurella multocida]AON58200.1 hypothetical protein AZI96_05415 [Pasteurella multocida]AUK44878.1 hypothetical protein A4212_06570 [Pasteurella multocida]AUK45184.1 hypothetical protein A4212_08270 [Pasteurella multocida]AUK45503.1 hypothetical protein A4212_09980 [Pasteurella multocida]